MADIPAAPKETGSNAVEILFLTNVNGVNLEAALLRATRSETINGQLLGELAVGVVPSENTDCAIAGVTVGSTSTQALAANTARRFAVFTNNSNEVIYLALGVAAAMNQGIRLNPNGGGYEINLLNAFTGVVNAICASGGKSLCVQEG